MGVIYLLIFFIYSLQILNSYLYLHNINLNQLCYSGYDNIVEMLIQKGANVNAPTDDGITPLYATAVGGNLLGEKSMLN